MEFTNRPLSGLTVSKLDSYDNTPIQRAMFKVERQDGSFVGEYETNEQGLFTINGILGWFKVTEIRPADGYIMTDTMKTVEVKADYPAVLVFYNERKSSIIIEKTDEEGKPLAGDKFRVTAQNGAFIGEFTAPISGIIEVSGNNPGWYLVEEIQAPDGYIISEASKSVEVKPSTPSKVTFINYRMPSLVIEKVDQDGNPLANAEFEVRTLDDTLIERVVSNDGGTVTISELAPGSYKIIESRPPQGYIADNMNKIIQIKAGETATVKFINVKMSETSIKKISGDINEPLQGVVFEVTRLNGERVQNPSDRTYEFVTDASGMIYLPFLQTGTYVATEIKALDGYSQAAPTVFTVGENDDATVIIRNYRQAELTIRKINSLTREPLEGVIFEIFKPNGQRLVNSKTGLHDFITDRKGLVYLPVIDDGTYFVKETRALQGFISSSEPILLTVDSLIRHREHLLVIENTPASGLLIIKTDAQTSKALEGVVFEVRHADGRIVQGNILHGSQQGTEHNSPQLNSNGSFTTDRSGRINLNHLQPGVYHVTEVTTLAGYELDTTVHVVTVEAGTQEVLEVENTPLSGLRIKKTDSITGEPIMGVEFMIFDQNNKVVGNFYSDDRGIVDFPAILEAGRYTIRETRPAEGYAQDNTPKTVDFVPGKVTEINWQNTPIGGQIQIQKVSGDYNEQNALPAGTPLSGAIFEIYSYKTGNLVDRIISNERGMAVSKPLPMGRYYAQEVTAPAHYKINVEIINFDIEFDRQIVKVTFPNFSANLGVSIDKTGAKEAMQGNNIFYDIQTIRNDSTVPLRDFFWRDILQTNAVRADKLITGTFNVSLTYKVMAKTNKGSDIVVADNLMTTKNNVIELKPVHLGLASDEYLTEITVYFGQVPTGFTAVEKPRVYVDVLSEHQTFLPNGLMFVNKVDIGGKVVGTDEWVIGNSTVVTTIYNPRKIPQSGN